MPAILALSVNLIALPLTLPIGLAVRASVLNSASEQLVGAGWVDNALLWLAGASIVLLIVILPAPLLAACIAGRR